LYELYVSTRGQAHEMRFQYPLATLHGGHLGRWKKRDLPKSIAETR